MGWGGRQRRLRPFKRLGSWVLRGKEGEGEEAVFFLHVPFSIPGQHAAFLVHAIQQHPWPPIWRGGSFKWARDVQSDCRWRKAQLLEKEETADANWLQLNQQKWLDWHLELATWGMLKCQRGTPPHTIVMSSFTLEEQDFLTQHLKSVPGSWRHLR